MAFPRYLKLALFIFIVALFQISVLPRVWIFNIKPDLLLILALLIAMNSRNLSEAVIFGLGCGLVKDIFGGRLFGFNALIMALSASLVYGILHVLNKELKVIKFFILILATFINYTALSIIFQKPYIFLGLLEAAVNCLFLPFIDILYGSFIFNTDDRRFPS